MVRTVLGIFKVNVRRRLSADHCDTSSSTYPSTLAFHQSLSHLPSSTHSGQVFIHKRDASAAENPECILLADGTHFSRAVCMIVVWDSGYSAFDPSAGSSFQTPVSTIESTCGVHDCLSLVITCMAFTLSLAVYRRDTGERS